MTKKSLIQQIAYRCPECGIATVGLLGGVSDVSDMLRLRCECGASSLDIKKEAGGKIKIDCPCVYCKTNHTYTVPDSLIKREITTRLSCPYSSQDILFIAEAEAMGEELTRSGEELSRILASFEAEELSDIQPKELDDADFEPDAAIFDVLNFVVRDLESIGGIKCPCGKGGYSLRFCDEGAEVVCESCGTSYTFYCTSQASAEAYLDLDEIKLS